MAGISAIPTVFSAYVVPAESGSIVTDEFALLPCDLRDTAAVLAALKLAGLQPEAPTIILAECVLVYMPPDSSQRLVAQLGQLLPTAAFVVYEQVESPTHLRTTLSARMLLYSREDGSNVSCQLILIVAKIKQQSS